MCGGGCGSVKGEEGSHVISHGAVCESGEGGRNMTRKNRQRGKSTEDEVSTVVVCDDAVCDNFNYNSRGAPVKIRKKQISTKRHNGAFVCGARVQTCACKLRSGASWRVTMILKLKILAVVQFKMLQMIAW